MIGTCAHPNQDYPIYSVFDWNGEYNIYTGPAILFGIPIINFFGWYTYYRKYRREPQQNVLILTDSV